jgi:hypothetical protein
MSDAAVLQEIERMESWMRDPQNLPGPEDIAEWNRAFERALASAERGPGWSALMVRSRALGSQVNERSAALASQRDQVRVELDTQERGGRALKGYGATVR